MSLKEEKIKIIEISVMVIVIGIIAIEMYVGNVLSETKDKEDTMYINIPIEIDDDIIFKVKNEHIYLALNDNSRISYTLESEEEINEEVTFSSLDESIAVVNESGVVTGVNVGSTSIKLQVLDVEKEIKVTVTDLINIKPMVPDSNKTLLSCQRYTKEENDLLDAVLENRVNMSGYKTRAGVIAAARFLTLEFPYKISYFSENGRLSTNNVTYYVDGEGRYYHKGLYLHQSRFGNIISSLRGPNIWGCNMYMNIVQESRRNGLDCSGFISWVLVNGGYDPGDIGAGVTNFYDMTDLGEKTSIRDAMNNNTLKVGDLLSGPNLNGGHIAILIGIKDGEYYVAESLWGVGATFGVVLRSYNKNNMYSYFKWRINMDNFYGDEGEYQDYWF